MHRKSKHIYNKLDTDDTCFSLRGSVLNILGVIRSSLKEDTISWNVQGPGDVKNCLSVCPLDKADFFVLQELKKTAV